MAMLNKSTNIYIYKAKYLKYASYIYIYIYNFIYIYIYIYMCVCMCVKSSKN